MFVQFKIKEFVLVIISGLALTLNAQNRQMSDYTRELSVKFSSADEKLMEKSIKVLLDADKLFADAEGMYANLTDLEKNEKLSDAYIKSLKKLQQASEAYKEGYYSLYMVFKEKCNTFWTKMKRVQQFAAGVEKGKYYEKQAFKQLAMTRQRRDQVLWTDRYEYALVKIKEANELDLQVIRDQGRALQIFSDYPVEYNYGWENDITLEEINELFKNPAVNEPPTDIYATIDKDAKVDARLMEEIIFKVQIAAHSVPLTEEYLRTIYKGTMSIDMIYEDDWYKYSIGRYHGFDEANKTLNECNVRKAFIVAYQGGKKLTIQEAVNLFE